MELLPLPHPDRDAPQLAELLPTAAHITLYRLLYESRSAPLTTTEMDAAFAEDNEPQSQLQRRRRDLYRFFVIEKVRKKGERAPRYVLRGRRPDVEAGSEAISLKTRAEVLRLGRCAQCGRAPRDEPGVVLEIDHKVPKKWGGHPTDPSNLQPLCRECNAGKKDYYATMDDLGEDIAAAAEQPEVHKRLGLMLKAAAPREVRMDILELVANLRDAQDDWQKRLRELREIGWDYKVRRKKGADGRVWSFYRLTRSAEWPEGSVSAALATTKKMKRKSRVASGEKGAAGG